MNMNVNLQLQPLEVEGVRVLLLVTSPSLSKLGFGPAPNLEYSIRIDDHA